MSRNFYSTKYQVTVLSEGEPPDPGMNLLDIEHLITQGPCVGNIEHVRTVPVTPAHMRALLEDMDADMSVFDLVDEDEIYDPQSVEEEEEMLAEHDEFRDDD